MFLCEHINGLGLYSNVSFTDSSVLCPWIQSRERQTWTHTCPTEGSVCDGDVRSHHRTWRFSAWRPPTPGEACDPRCERVCDIDDVLVVATCVEPRKVLCTVIWVRSARSFPLSLVYTVRVRVEVRRRREFDRLFGAYTVLRCISRRAQVHSKESRYWRSWYNTS